MSNPWRRSWRADPEARVVADRHYNRQKVGSPQFVPPGRCVVLVAGAPVSALWVTSWPFARYVKHRWAGAWVCSCFRREGHPEKASALIAALVTFLDRRHVAPVKVRGVETWGRTWTLAGFEPDGETVGGLLAFRLPPERMPLVTPQQAGLFANVSADVRGRPPAVLR